MREHSQWLSSCTAFHTHFQLRSLSSPAHHARAGVSRYILKPHTPHRAHQSHSLAGCVSPPGCSAQVRFNVLSFGSTFEWMFPEAPALLTAATRDAALAQINHFDANFGGTELLPALRAAFALAEHVCDKHKCGAIVSVGGREGVGG